MKPKAKRVAILTRTGTNNFGTILQAYALQNYINSLGFDTFVVDDSIPRNEYISTFTEEKPSLSIKERMYCFFDHIIEEIRLFHSIKFRYNTSKFKKNRIRYFNPTDTQELNSKFDIFISGSDQIWAVSAEPTLFPFFMQDFVSDKKTQISYAVSIGERVFPEAKITLVAKLINRFDYLSVRELSSKETLQQYTDHNITVTCDPVLLLNNDTWDTLAGKRIIKEEYIFCYFLSENAWYYNKIQELANQYNILVCLMKKKDIDFATTKYKCIKRCSPEDFLNYIKFSKFVLTDSFHATLFSIIFGRNFNVLERFTDNKNTQNNRLLYILDRCNVKNLYIREDQPINFEKVDYGMINASIDSFTNESKQYLCRALN